MKRLTSAVMLWLCASPALAEPMTFRGGALDGLRAEMTATGEMRLLPGVAAPSPVAAAERTAIAALVDRLRHGGGFGRVALEPIAMDALSGAALERQFRRVIATCRSDTPYAIDEDTVRVGWLCGGRLAWFSIYAFSGDAVESIQFGRAEVPAVVEAPAGN
jgi:hypothetical protein